MGHVEAARRGKYEQQMAKKVPCQYGRVRGMNAKYSTLHISCTIGYEILYRCNE